MRPGKRGSDERERKWVGWVQNGRTGDGDDVKSGLGDTEVSDHNVPKVRQGVSINKIRESRTRSSVVSYIDSDCSQRS